MSASARSRLLLLALLLSGPGLCGCFEAPEQATGTRECRDLDGYGGEISYEGARLELPTGALQGTTRICIDLETAEPSGYRMVTPHYRFEPLGLPLNVPAKVTLTLPAGTPAGMGLYWSRTQAGGGYDRLATSEDGTQVSAPIALLGIGFGGAPDSATFCGPSNCAGCCDENGQCQAGDGRLSCGSDGISCRACPDDSSCTGGRCLSTHPACGPHNCNGCCVISGGQTTCHPGTERNACGAGGEICSGCEADERCEVRSQGSAGGVCTVASDAGTQSCGPQSCSGCCLLGSSGPLCLSGLAHSNCGSAGGHCASCTAGEACVAADTGTGGVCQAPGDGGVACNALNCAGCCAATSAGSVCLSGLPPPNCGSNGAVCDTCSGNELCTPVPGGAGGQCFSGQCGPHNCSGCCANTSNGAICLNGVTNTNCGSGGGVCRACPGGTVCQSGACK